MRKDMKSEVWTRIEGCEEEKNEEGKKICSISGRRRKTGELSHFRTM